VDQEPHRLVALVEFHQEVPRLLQHPRRIRLVRARAVLDAPTADGDEGEYIEAVQPDRVYSEEITGEDRLAVRSEEVAPRLRVAPRCWRQAGLGEDVADGTRRDNDVELAQFACDAQVAPTRILAGKPQDQLACLTADRRPARGAVPIGSALSDQPAMPGHERLGLHEEDVPGAAQQHTAARG
jgi:hypothetical protein